MNERRMIKFCTILLVISSFHFPGCNDDPLARLGNSSSHDQTTAASDNLSETNSGHVEYKDGNCAYECVWSVSECTGSYGGIKVDGACEQGQTCCFVGEKPKVQCAGTCKMNWEDCPSGMQVTEGNCSDAQQICCDSSNTYYDDNEANNSSSNDGDNDGSTGDGTVDNGSSGSNGSTDGTNSNTGSDQGNNESGSDDGGNTGVVTVDDIDVTLDIEVQALESRIHYDNPFAETSKWYVNEWWSDNARASGGEAIADVSTGVWMDRIAAIEPYGDQAPNEGFGLREHLDAVLDQGADLFMFVVYDLPGRDCAAEASNGELPASAAGMVEYKQEYIGRIVKILSDEKYAGITVVAITEIDSLPNLVTNSDMAACQEVVNNSPFGYTEGIRFALTQFKALPNVHSYVDIAHSGWLGWDERFEEATAFIADVIAGADHAGPTPAPGWDSINGFISNTSNYTPLEEPYLSDSEAIAGNEGTPLRSAPFYDWNPIFGELEFTKRWREAMIRHGASNDIGMLIDTGRNGWGGSERPSGASSSSDIAEIVNESRIDRRPHRGSWCNQRGGIGERPQATPASHIDAYVWVKPPGESDGVSTPNFEIDPNDKNKKYDPMCGPNDVNRYAEDAATTKGQGISTGAMDGAPHAGRWFEEGFKVLVENAYPPL